MCAMRYRMVFQGRVIGAIGLFYECERIVEATDEEKARAMLYETHEHISNVRCIRMEEKSCD